MPLTANVLYVSNKLDCVFNTQKCFVVQRLECFNRDSLALVLADDRLSCPAEIVENAAEVEVLESAEFSLETVELLWRKMRLIVNRYNENFAD